MAAHQQSAAGAIGAGPTMASAAGADLADLEFCQFHPTALSLPGTRFDGLLITEAVRGEGATLLDAAGRRFTDELAPRDAVTAAILDRLEADGTDAVKLDLRGARPRPLPQRLRVAARGRARPERRADPGRPRLALHDGRHRGRPRRPLLAGRASSPSASAPAPACTAPTGSPPTRSASASSSAAGPRRQRWRRRRRPSRPSPATGASSRRPRRPATPSGTSPARCAAPEQLEQLLADPYPLAAAIAACALARRESRGGHLRADFPGARPAARRHPPRSSAPTARSAAKPGADFALRRPIGRISAKSAGAIASSDAARRRRRRDLHRRRPLSTASSSTRRSCRPRPRTSRGR